MRFPALPLVLRRCAGRGAKLAWQPRSPQKDILTCSSIFVAILCLRASPIESWLEEVTAVARFANLSQRDYIEEPPAVETFECGSAGA